MNLNNFKRFAMYHRVLEFYSGIGRQLPNTGEAILIVPSGGLHLAFKRSHVPGSVVCAFDWDQTASRVYSANYGPNIVKQRDISTLQASDLVPFQADTWLLSPSCQPYTTLNPFAKGSADPRAKSFLHLVEDVLPVLVSQRNHPNHLLIENVAGFEVLNILPNRRTLSR